jgi:cytochrome c biogenesis protein CcmG/thiol:disulfide interchange protein DsbE
MIPSPLLGKPAPAFDLEDLRDPARRLTLDDLRGRVSLLNVWATWCVACHAEHPFLMELARAGVPIFGVNYKDDRGKAIEWLRRLGDPYAANIFDPEGELALDLGVYGAPETFVLDAQGIIAFKHIGPLTAEVWQDTLEPLLRELGGGG